MNYAMQLSASGVLTSMYRQDVLANNLANIGTIGYKADIPATRQRDAATREDGLYNLPSNRLLERLGAGILLEPNRTSTAQGPIEASSNALDVAIRGPGFLVVSVGGGADSDRLRLTRDGRMTLSDEGWLVQSTSGHPVLDKGGNRIRINPANGPVSIQQDGQINQNGAPVASLQFVDVPDPAGLEKIGNGYFRPTASQASNLAPAQGRIQDHALESSSVDPVKAIMGITSAAGSIANNARMIQLADELMGRAINSFGRVA